MCKFVQKCLFLMRFWNIISSRLISNFYKANRIPTAKIIIRPTMLYSFYFVVYTSYLEFLWYLKFQSCKKVNC